MRRRRQNAPPGEFKDPLPDYAAPEYEDELERALCEDPVTALQLTPFETIQPQTPIHEAVGRMVSLNVACLMVAQADRLLGILSERDVLNKVAECWASLCDQPVSEVMTRDPVVAYETDTPAKLLNLMTVGGFRHVPILDVDERVVGIVGPRRVTHYLQHHFPD